MRYWGVIAILLIACPAFAEAPGGGLDLFDPGEAVGAGVPSGTNLCVDEPTNNTCVYESSGEMIFLAGGNELRWDGVEFGLVGSTLNLEFAAGSVEFSVGSSGRFQYNGNYFRSSNSAGGGLVYAAGTMILPGLLPYRGNLDTGICSDGTDKLSLCSNSISIVEADATGSYATTTLTGAFIQGTTSQSLAASGQVTPNSSRVRLSSTGGAVTLGNPQITAATADGTCIEFVGTSDTDYITFTDGTGLRLDNNISFALQQANTITLCYDATVDATNPWYEKSGRKDN